MCPPAPCQAPSKQKEPKGLLKTNEPVKGGLRQAGQVDVYIVELTQDEGQIRLHLECKTTELVVALSRVNEENIPMQPLAGKGFARSWRASQFPVVQGRVIECEATRPLPAARYRIAVGSAEANGIGPYTIKILEPEFAPAANNPAVRGDNQAESGTEVRQLRDEIASLRRLLQDFELRLKNLEKKPAGAR
jgi:hypothetical protein